MFVTRCATVTGACERGARLFGRQQFQIFLKECPRTLSSENVSSIALLKTALRATHDPGTS